MSDTLDRLVMENAALRVANTMLRAENISLRARVDAKAAPLHASILGKQAEIARRYIAGEKVITIAAEMKTSPGHVSRVARKLGLPSRSPQQRQAMEKHWQKATCAHCGARLDRRDRCPECHSERETAPQPMEQAA